MAGKSDYLETAFLDAVFGGAAFPTFPFLYFALFTDPPTDAGGGVEVAGNNYARARVINDSGSWNAAEAGTPSRKTNRLPIVFPIPSAPWDNVIAWGIYDALTAGNLLFWDNFPTLQIVTAGHPPAWDAGFFSVYES